MEKYIINTDGGSRGNPGPSALGVVIKFANGSLKKEYGEYLGHGTNNEAEYKAVIFGLKKLKQLVGKSKTKEIEVTVCTDSELLTRQINGHYKIMDSKIQALFFEIWNLKMDFGHITFKHVFREENKEADRMVNAVLDKELTGKLDF